MSLPHRLGRLRRISRIGSGGFATVWLYADPDLQSNVAVKALADNWAARPDIRDRFLEEARILRRADSDHIVRVYDLGETDDGTPYFVMNYADRGTVADLLNAPSRDLQMIADLVTQAGFGLQRLHSMGILHRDVKPQNLLLSGDHIGATRLMVADLGVAKATLHASGITQVVGTPAYMAPEQADPTRGVDNRCDVHALGAVAYHLVTGQPVRTGGVESLFSREPIQPPTTLVGDLPHSIDQVVLRAVAHDPEQRWPDVDTFTAAFMDATTRTQTRMFQPAQIEAQVWQPDFPSPSSPGPSPMTSPGLSPVHSPAPSQTGYIPPPVSPVPPGGSSPDGRRPSARRAWLVALAALIVVAAILGGVLAFQEFRDDGSSASAPDAGLPSGWSEGESSGESTWTYTNDDDHLALAVSRKIVEGSSVKDVAAEHVDSDQMDDFTVQVDQELSDARSGRWEIGWELQYARTEGASDSSDDCDYFWRWYFGNADPATAGYVEICGDQEDIKGNSDAEELLATVRDEVMLGDK